ncbi:hypothetical protein SARC_03970 [Sphaeroforma arctica JP610]|uniref:Uncharacterized protein n=1 Tax=Sphaeroforma arctica JP610 TaxID=667725 RepID=A0A0L0G4H4_9EUKA|nr:hypothetical protein SARC_03970 [Sphaeroforma arctica JP610]KNC83794.1 hypothetical protein SARC_03970 [Sphaeroforma arctica JP610]|eukprot:XP_014157696.1 hypothetical protein SARC_03970 [Sphaeroforma arctica JP610]
MQCCATCWPPTLDLRPASEELCNRGKDTDGPPRPKLITQAAQLLGEDIEFCISLFKFIQLSDVVTARSKRVNMWAEDIMAGNNSGMGMGNVMSVLINGSANSSMNQKWLEAWELIRPRAGPLLTMIMSKKAFVCALVPILERVVTHVSWKRIRTFFETFNMTSPLRLRFEDERYVVKMAIPVIDHAKHIAVNLYVRGDVTKERIIETTIMNDILVGNEFVKYRLYTASLESQEYYVHDGCASGFFEHMAQKNSLDAILDDKTDNMPVDAKN